MVSKFAQAPSNITARTPLNPDPSERQALNWLRLLMSLLLLVTFAFALWAPNGLALPVYYIASLILIVALVRVRDRILVAVICTLLMGVELALSPHLPGIRTWGYLLNHGFAIIMLWAVVVSVSRHRKTQEAMHANERIANERLAQLNTIYASAPVGLCFVDRDLRYVSVNNALAELNGGPADFFIGKTVRETVPEVADVVESHYRRVLETGQPVIDEEVQSTRGQETHHALCSYYPVRDECGELIGVNVAVRDITRRKQAESDTLFLLDLGEAIRFAADGDELLWAVAVALGEHLKTSRCAFFERDSENNQLLVRRDYHPHVTSLVGNCGFGVLNALFYEAANSGQIVAISDVEKDPRGADHVSTYRSFNIRALAITPLVRDGQLVAALIIATHEPHEWSEREITLINIVAERSWLAVEKLRFDRILRETDVALRDADRRKDEFLATLAHELRNPLSLIRNVTALQNTPASPQDDPRWGQDIIERQVNYLTRLTDDLFDVSRITREKLELEKERLNLIEVIQSAVEATRPLIEQRHHELTVALSQHCIYVEADRVRLTQVFTNLLNNAAKYTPNDGHVWLNVEQAGDTVVVRIKDTGVGIAAENLPHLFDLFYQVDRSFTRAEGGLGLGLTLVQRLVQMHGGKVEVRSDGLNRGSEFTVHLTILPVTSAVDAPRPLLESSPVLQSRGRRILVADDFPQSAEILARLLRQDGNEVQIAQDGMEAIEAAAQFRPDVAVLDIAMPKLSGYEAARIIREQPWGKRIFLIALSGLANHLDHQRTKDAGFDAHLTKPAKYERLMEVLSLLPSADQTELASHREL